MKTKLSMLDTLNETISAYTSKTRAVDANGSCRFLTDDGRMCAIGRCLIKPEDFDTEDREAALKPEYRGYPSRFWWALQTLHDRAHFWDDEGLSDRGVNHIAMHPILSAVKDGKDLSGD